MPTRLQEAVDVRRPVDALVTLESYNSINASARIIGARNRFVKTLEETGSFRTSILISQLFARFGVQGLTARRQYDFKRMRRLNIEAQA